MSENEYQEKIDALEALLDEWENKESSPDGYINHQAHVFIRDGIVKSTALCFFCVKPMEVIRAGISERTYAAWRIGKEKTDHGLHGIM